MSAASSMRRQSETGNSREILSKLSGDSQGIVVYLMVSFAGCFIRQGEQAPGYPDPGQ